MTLHIRQKRYRDEFVTALVFQSRWAQFNYPQKVDNGLYVNQHLLKDEKIFDDRKRSNFFCSRLCLSAATRNWIWGRILLDFSPNFRSSRSKNSKVRSSTYKLACFCTWVYNFLFHAWSSLFLLSSIFQHPYFTGMTLAPTVEEELPAKPPPPRPTPPARPAQPPARPSEPPARPAAPPARPAPPPGW